MERKILFRSKEYGVSIKNEEGKKGKERTFDGLISTLLPSINSVQAGQATGRSMPLKILNPKIGVVLWVVIS